VLPDATGANVSIPLGPIQTGPANSATGVGGTTSFTWSSAGQSLNRLEIDGPYYRVAIYTASNSATMADLIAAGLTPTSSQPSSWQVTSAVPGLAVIGPTADDAATGPWFIDCNSARTRTATRFFTNQ
jgi:hypothetical protein